MRLLATLTSLLLLMALAAPVAAQPTQVPPTGVGGLVLLVSDGTTWLPVGTATFDPSAFCGPLR